MKRRPVKRAGPTWAEKRARFAQEFVRDLNATQAAIRAGYSQRTAKQQGSRLLTYADVQAAVQTARAEIAKATELSAVWVLENLKIIAVRSMQAEAVFNDEGEPTGEYTFEGNVANRSLELIGKHLGMFTERVEIDDLRSRDESELQARSDEIDRELTGRTH